MEATERRDGYEGASQPTLVIYSREGARSVPLPERGTLTVGRAAESAEIVIDDGSLSRLHARFVVDGERIHVEDAGSTNGTFVRGQRVTSAPLADGSEVRLGDVIVLVRDPASAMLVAAGVEAYDTFLDRVDEELVRSKHLGPPTTLLHVEGPGAEALQALVTRIKPALRPVDRVGLYARNVVLALLPETSAAAATHLRGELERRGVRVGAATAHGGTAAELVERARDAAIAKHGDRDDAPSRGPVFVSPAMQSVVAQLRRVATSQLSVLLRGETGSGKDVLATMVHEASGRRGPLRSINCGAIPPSLLESTLFGHEKGAFTGADRAMPGLFEQANGGTVFLDEVGELSAAAQAALLRVLENHRVQRLGSDKVVDVDVRVVAATHVDLLEASKSGKFREDLFYRLEGFGAVVPPLRARREDIGPLAGRFVEAANARHGRSLQGLSPLALEVLAAYAFPGNVRELKNAIERAVVVASGAQIEVEDLPERIRSGFLAAAPASATVASATTTSTTSATGDAGPESTLGNVDLRERVRAYERKLIERALSENDGNRTRTAEALGLPVRSLFYKLKELGFIEK
ncbi:MAG: sigma 54-interacting transcriptional regulator [Deltaproteobacteria bacterium]|nr:sigma 54-interacting transcriptional regulator [Deltaproteobacteria bacterium]